MLPSPLPPIVFYQITTTATTFFVRNAAPGTLRPTFFSATNVIEAITSFVLPPFSLPSPREPGSAPLAPITRNSNVPSHFPSFHFNFFHFIWSIQYISFLPFIYMHYEMEVAFRIVCLLLKFHLVLCVRDKLAINLLPSGRMNFINFLNFIMLHV